MAIPIEQAIMREIGLGEPPRWYSGSGSCAYIRQSASDRLPDAIAKHANAGEKIAPPNPDMMRIAKQAATWDENEYKLTIAWQVIGDIIQFHERGWYEKDNPQFWQDSINEIIKAYAPARVLWTGRRWNVRDIVWGCKHDMGWLEDEHYG